MIKCNSSMHPGFGPCHPHYNLSSSIFSSETGWESFSFTAISSHNPLQSRWGLCDDPYMNSFWFCWCFVSLTGYSMSIQFYLERISLVSVDLGWISRGHRLSCLWMQINSFTTNQRTGGQTNMRRMDRPLTRHNSNIHIKETKHCKSALFKIIG